jgi:hypothetical protein
MTLQSPAPDESLWIAPLDRVVARLIAAALVGAFIFFTAMWVQVGNIVDFFGTAAAMTISTLLQMRIHGTRFIIRRGSRESTRWSDLWDAIDQLPLWEKMDLDSDVVVKTTIALGTGVIAAWAESAMSTTVLAGWDPWAGKLVALGIILTPVYLVLGWIQAGRTYLASPAVAKVRAALLKGFGLQAREMGRLGRASTSAMLRVGLSVMIRGVALVLVPVLFLNFYGVFAMVVFCMLSIVMGPEIVNKWRQRARRTRGEREMAERQRFGLPMDDNEPSDEITPGRPDPENGESLSGDLSA